MLFGGGELEESWVRVSDWTMPAEWRSVEDWGPPGLRPVLERI